MTLSEAIEKMRKHRLLIGITDGEKSDSSKTNDKKSDSENKNSDTTDDSDNKNDDSSDTYYFSAFRRRLEPGTG